MSIFRKELKNLKAYVPGKSLETMKKEYNIDKIVKLASNENPLGPSKKAVEAMCCMASHVNLYPDPEAQLLKEKIGGINNIGPEQILIGGGGEELIRLIAHTFINEGEEAIMATPSFSLYKIAVCHMGGKLIEVPLVNFEHDLDGFKKAITNQTKIIFICNPNNPTGNITDSEKIRKFASELPEDIVLVIDEAYYDYAKSNSNYLNGLDILRERKNTIVLRTLSKVAGLASLRIGYIFSSEEIINEMGKIKKIFSVSNLAQNAGLAALDDTKHLNDTVDLNAESLGMIARYCDEKGFKYADYDANFIFMDIGVDSKVVNEELLKRGVIIRPGFLWGYDTYLRVSSGTLEQTKYFIDALDEILKDFSK